MTSDTPVSPFSSEPNLSLEVVPGSFTSPVSDLPSETITEAMSATSDPTDSSHPLSEPASENRLEQLPDAIGASHPTVDPSIHQDVDSVIDQDVDSVIDSSIDADVVDPDVIDPDVINPDVSQLIHQNIESSIAASASAEAQSGEPISAERNSEGTATPAPTETQELPSEPTFVDPKESSNALLAGAELRAHLELPDDFDPDAAPEDLVSPQATTAGDDRPLVPEIPDNLQVRLKSEDGKLMLILPPEADAAKTTLSFSWNEIWQQFMLQLSARERFWKPNTAVHLVAGDRLLDNRQLQAIDDALSDIQLQLRSVSTSRRQTAVVCATAGYSVEQVSAAASLVQAAESAQMMEEPLYVQMTLRSGTEIRHNGTVIVLGDLNPGSSVVAEGDILVWGRLRGVAHAGSKGNARCLIMALQMEPTQIRIADFVARAPENPPAQYYPEVAYVSPQGSIRIARAIDFQRPEWES